MAVRERGRAPTSEEAAARVGHQVTLAEMWHAAESEAAHIEQNERIWGPVRGAMPDRQRRAEVFLGIVRMIERIEADPVIMGRLRTTKREAL